MAVRVSHTNNSSGHDGTYVYRSTSPMDPQALPAPIADEPPVALGATFEYVDDPADGAYYYRTQDHEGGQVSAASGEVSITLASIVTYDTTFNSVLTYSNGDLTALKDTTAGGWELGNAQTTASKSTGKWYWEVSIVDMGSSVGVLCGGSSDGAATTSPPGTTADSGFGYGSFGTFYNGATSYTVETATAGDVIGFAVDVDTSSVSVYKNNALLNTYSFNYGTFVLPASAMNDDASSALALNSTNITYAPPSGYAAVGG